MRKPPVCQRGIGGGGVGAHTGGHEVKNVIKERVGVDEHGGRRRGWLAGLWSGRISEKGVVYTGRPQEKVLW